MLARLFSSLLGVLSRKFAINPVCYPERSEGPVYFVGSGSPLRFTKNASRIYAWNLRDITLGVNLFELPSHSRSAPLPLQFLGQVSAGMNRSIGIVF